MRAWVLPLAFLLGGSLLFAQEDCTNGIDDDGDGLVDLNDIEDCRCTSANTTTLSLLPNPSFEDFAGDRPDCSSLQPGGLPDAVNQVNCLSGWQRASLGTTDAWNALTFSGAGPYFPKWLPQPLPSGTGVAGFWVGIKDGPDSEFYNGDGSSTTMYREYLAAGLVGGQRMEVDKPYRLTFSLGFMDPQIAVDDEATIDIRSPETIELSIYGVREVSQLYFGSYYGCPEASGAEGYELIANLTVSGRAGKWSAASVEFMSPGTYAGFAIGGSCAADVTRKDEDANYRNYYFIDDLILNHPSAFSMDGTGSVSVSGQTVCDTITLTAPIERAATFQWYRDGIAVTGATDRTLRLPGGELNEGDYRVRTTTAGKCQLSEVITVRRPVLIDQFPDTVAVCLTEEITTIRPRRAGSAYFRWEDGSTEDALEVTAPGLYSVTVTQACLTTVEYVTVVAEEALRYTVDQSPATACPGDTVVLGITANSREGQYFFRELSSGASLASSSGTLRVVAGKSGPVLAFIGNACGLVTDTLTINFDCPPVVDTDTCVRMDVTTTGSFLDCTDDQSGQLRVTVSGGLPPYAFQLNDGRIQAQPLFEGLTSGNYTVTVTDANGCESTQSTALSFVAPIKLSGPSQRRIPLGEFTRLTLLTDDVHRLPGEVSWSPADGLSCTDCLAPAAAPLTTTVYTVTYREAGGCTSTDRLTVTVDTAAPIYVPTAFRPLGSAPNNRFTVHPGAGVGSIQYLSIFDRWGGLVWEQTGAAGEGWDGTRAGRRLPSGVFTYVASALLKNGTVTHLSGDVTLLW